jgi:hypothetical protein
MDTIPCRRCGGTRADHDGRYFIDHRYRAERYCVVDGKVATWYVGGVTMCSGHKGATVRRAAAADSDLHLSRID